MTLSRHNCCILPHWLGFLSEHITLSSYSEVTIIPWDSTNHATRLLTHKSSAHWPHQLLSNSSAKSHWLLHQLYWFLSSLLLVQQKSSLSPSSLFLCQSNHKCNVEIDLNQYNTICIKLNPQDHQENINFFIVSSYIYTGHQFTSPYNYQEWTFIVLFCIQRLLNKHYQWYVIIFVS